MGNFFVKFVPRPIADTRRKPITMPEKPTYKINLYSHIPRGPSLKTQYFPDPIEALFITEDKPIRPYYNLSEKELSRLYRRATKLGRTDVLEDILYEKQERNRMEQGLYKEELYAFSKPTKKTRKNKRKATRK